VSRHWKPDGTSDRWTPAEGAARPKKQWPEGATAGLVLVAVACLGLGMVLYQVAGPRDVFEEDGAAE
jgi:hypothetical protein